MFFANGNSYIATNRVHLDPLGEEAVASMAVKTLLAVIKEKLKHMVAWPASMAVKTSLADVTRILKHIVAWAASMAVMTVLAVMIRKLKHEIARAASMAAMTQPAALALMWPSQPHRRCMQKGDPLPADFGWRVGSW